MCHLNPSTYFTTTMFDVSTATFTKKIIMPCIDKFICYVAIRWWMAWGDLCLTNIVIWGSAIDGTSLEYIVPKRSRKYCIFMVNGNIMPHMHCWKLASWTLKQRLSVSLNAMQIKERPFFFLLDYFILGGKCIGKQISNCYTLFPTPKVTRFFFSKSSDGNLKEMNYFINLSLKAQIEYWKKKIKTHFTCLITLQKKVFICYWYCCRSCFKQ